MIIPMCYFTTFQVNKMRFVLVWCISCNLILLKILFLDHNNVEHIAMLKYSHALRQIFIKLRKAANFPDMNFLEMIPKFHSALGC